MLDGISCPRTVKTSMKHGFEHCVEVRVWSIGIYCSCRLNVMTLTELIHAVKHTDSRPSPASSTSRLWRTVSYLFDFTICHLSPLPGPRRTPQTSRTRLQARVSLTATWDSFTSVKGGGRARRQIHLLQEARCYQSWPAILTSLIPYYTALLHLSPLAGCFHHI